MERTFYLFDREEFGWPQLISVAEVELYERTALPCLALAVLPFKAHENGLPAGGEFARVSRLEDGLIHSLEAAGAVYLGHITFKGSMTVAFHAPNPPAVKIAIKTGLFQKTTVTLESRVDETWSWFEREMSPTAVEREVSRNRGLHQTLRTHGDISSRERQVDFGVYFPTKEQSEAFLGIVTAQGYVLNEKGTWETGDNPPKTGCELWIVTNVEPLVIAAHCVYLREQAHLYGGDLDGWACPIAK